MKKQLLIAAVAATMTSVAFADVSITGGAKVNYTYTDTDAGANANVYKHDIDLTVVGKTGDTAVTMTVSNTNADNTITTTGLSDSLVVENAFVTSKVADVNIKMGQWAKTSDTLLTDDTGVIESGRLSLDTTVGGVKVQFEDWNGANTATTNARTTISGEMAGVKLAHTIYQTETDTKVKANVAGVSIDYRLRDRDLANTNTSSLQLDKEFNGMTFTYAAIDSDEGASAIDADAYIAGLNIKEADAFGVSMPLAGNTVQVKRISITDETTNLDADSTKLYLTRKLASGATFEAVYTDTDNATASDTSTLDLELAVKF